MAADEHQAADESIRTNLKMERSPEWPEVEKVF
jgi:hypothetical protein